MSHENKFLLKVRNDPRNNVIIRAIYIHKLPVHLTKEIQRGITKCSPSSNRNASIHENGNPSGLRIKR